MPDATLEYLMDRRRFIASSAVVLLTPTVAHSQTREMPMPVYTPEYLADRQAIVDAVNGYVVAADDRDFEACGAFMTEEVLNDHVTDISPSAVPPEPSIVRTTDLMAQWAELFSNFVSTQHMVTNHYVEIDGDRAVCRSYVEAIHIAQEALNAPRHHHVFGTYRHVLARQTDGRWLIAELHHQQRYALGNPAIFGH